MQRRSRAVGAVMAILGTVALALAGCAKADVPPPGAAPTEVVQAYLEALRLGDCSALGRLATRNQAERAWCGKGLTISDVTIGTAEGDPGSIARSDFEQAVFVPVRLNVQGGADSVTSGMRDWGYVLVRDSNVQRWRVADEGTKEQITTNR
jgi:hypothetical protein